MHTMNRAPQAVNQSNEQQLIRTASTYISENLKDYDPTKSPPVNFICLYAGSASLESEIIKRVRDGILKKKGVLINLICLIDIYTPNGDLERHAKQNCSNLATNIFTCTFGDLNKLLLRTLDYELAFTFCIAIHPQSPVFFQNPENVATDAAVFASQLESNATSRNINDSMQRFPLFNRLAAIKRYYMYVEQGIFYKHWLAHFNKEVAFMWRSGKINHMSLQTLNLQHDVVNVNNVDPHDFMTKHIVPNWGGATQGGGPKKHKRRHKAHRYILNFSC